MQVITSPIKEAQKIEKKIDDQIGNGEIDTACR